ncbi:hypothetical protein SUGI_0232320 [Cryptomeria japonica]|nr:hypothetical protein SUGI_0232320 [Cryptomeria japonica]
MSQNWEIETIPENLFTAMRGLRVLDLSSTRISTLPASVGKIVLLKVLNLRDTRVYKVPECVRYLKSLLFLVMPYDCKYIPVWISKLKILQHLECENVYRMPKGVSDMNSWRALRTGHLKLSIKEDEFMRLEDLAKMTQLQELLLELHHENEMEMERIEEGVLVQLIKMSRLNIWNMMNASALFSEKMRTMRDLESLQLYSFVVPGWICDLANLRELELRGCLCIDYPALQRMPNLVRLVLDGDYLCRELPKAFGKSGGFPHLRFFTIQFFINLEEFLKLEEGAMACLEEFRLQHCWNVKKVGEGLERLKRLKVFDFTSSRKGEVREALKKGGKYCKKIKVINSRVTIRA